jgi:hypothetical protein
VCRRPVAHILTINPEEQQEMFRELRDIIEKAQEVEEAGNSLNLKELVPLPTFCVCIGLFKRCMELFEIEAISSLFDLLGQEAGNSLNLKELHASLEEADANTKCGQRDAGTLPSWAFSMMSRNSRNISCCSSGLMVSVRGGREEISGSWK